MADRRNPGRDRDGAPEQRTAGVRWCARLGVEVTADDLVVVADGQHAIHMWLLAVLRPGDTLLTGRLTFPMAVAAAELRGLNVAGVDPWPPTCAPAPTSPG